MFAGRSRQAKRRLYQALVRNFGTLGVAPTSDQPHHAPAR
jgi:hypothetical protein